MKKIYIILSFICLSLSLFAVNNLTSLKGKITDAEGQAIIGATVYLPELKAGAISDINGNYIFTNLPKRTLHIQVSFLGFQMISEKLNLKTVANKNFVLEETVIEMNEMVVTGQLASSQNIKTPTPITVMTNQELQQNSSTNIIDAISSQPGVSQITTGSGISKPVIRGLGYNRVVVLHDGIRQEGQQWGDEHGVEIDENQIYRVEILKGPASLMYGSDEMAGVISLFSAPILPQETMRLNALANYQTNNGLYNYSFDFAGHKKSFVWDARYSRKQAHAYQNINDGYVYNSGFSEDAVSALLGINKSWGYSHLQLSAYHLTPGIIEGERDSATGKFVKPVVDALGVVGDALATDADYTSYDHHIPYQQVYHYKALLNSNILFGEGSLTTLLAYQQNRRQPYGDVLSPNDYSLYFQLHTVNYDIHYLFPENQGYRFMLGVNGMYQHSLNKGTSFLLPEYKLFDAGAFITGKKSWQKLDLSGGLRFDSRSEAIDALYLNSTDEKTSPSDLTAYERFRGFSVAFEGISGSLGLSYQINNDWNTKLNISRGFRAPNISELAANGEHEGTMHYEIGDSELKAESSFQLDYELDYNVKHVSAKLNLFTNAISNYIYSHKISNAIGGDSIIGNATCFKFESGKAQIMGGEFYIDLHPHPWDWLHFENSFSYVYSVLANQSDSTKYLPFTPAPKWQSTIRVNINHLNKSFNNVYFAFGVEHDFEQNHIYSAYNTETATPAYTLLNANVGTDFMLHKKKIFSLYLSATNLTDLAYQSHLSRLKYLGVNNVTGTTGVYNMGRNFSLKLIVPVEL